VELTSPNWGALEPRLVSRSPNAGPAANPVAVVATSLDGQRRTPYSRGSGLVRPSRRDDQSSLMLCGDQFSRPAAQSGSSFGNSLWPSMRCDCRS